MRAVVFVHRINCRRLHEPAGVVLDPQQTDNHASSFVLPSFEPDLLLDSFSGSCLPEVLSACAGIFFLIECLGSQAYVEKKFGGIAPKKPLISKVCRFS